MRPQNKSAKNTCKQKCQKKIKQFQNLHLFKYISRISRRASGQSLSLNHFCKLMKRNIQLQNITMDGVLPLGAPVLWRTPPQDERSPHDLGVKNASKRMLISGYKKEKQTKARIHQCRKTLSNTCVPVIV